jgi:hypothetical protein
MTYQEYLQMMMRGGMNPSQLPPAALLPVQDVQTQYNRSIAPGPRVSGAEPMGYGGYTPLPSNVTNQALQAPPQQQPTLRDYQAKRAAMASMAPQATQATKPVMPQYKPAGQGLMQMADGRVMVMGGPGGTRILSGAEAEQAASYAGQVSGVQPGTGIAYDAKGKVVGGIGPGGERYGDLAGPSMAGAKQMKFDAASGRYVQTAEQGPGQSWLPTPPWMGVNPDTGEQYKSAAQWRASRGEGSQGAVRDYQKRISEMQQIQAAKEIAGVKADAEAGKAATKMMFDVATAAQIKKIDADMKDEAKFRSFDQNVAQPANNYFRNTYGAAFDEIASQKGDEWESRALDSLAYYLAAEIGYEGKPEGGATSEAVDKWFEKYIKGESGGWKRAFIPKQPILK